VKVAYLAATTATQPQYRNSFAWHDNVHATTVRTHPSGNQRTCCLEKTTLNRPRPCATAPGPDCESFAHFFAGVAGVQQPTYQYACFPRQMGLCLPLRVTSRDSSLNLLTYSLTHSLIHSLTQDSTAVHLLRGTLYKPCPSLFSPFFLQPSSPFSSVNAALPPLPLLTLVV
jgi:hypothetical protein